MNAAGREAETISEKLLLIYDGNCVLCLKSLEMIRNLPSTAEITAVPLQQEPLPEAAAHFPKERLQAEIHVIDHEGRVYKGAEAIIRVLRTVPRLKWVETVYRIPGMRPLARLIYKWIAKHRYKLFGKADETCNNGACSIHRHRSIK